MTGKEVFLILVLIGSMAVSILCLAGFSAKILIELVVLGTLAVSMMTKWERLKDSDRKKAKASALVHLAAILILFCCFLHEAGVF